MPAKFALTGLNYAHFAPITSNTETLYTAGLAKRFQGAMKLSANQASKNEGSSVAADDNPDWYQQSGQASTSERRTLTIGEMSLEQYADMTGSEVDTGGELIVNHQNRKPVPKYAFSIASAFPDNITYRHMKYYQATIMSVAYSDISTRGGSASVTNVEIDMLLENPAAEGAITSRQRDALLNLDWLKDFTDYKKA